MSESKEFRIMKHVPHKTISRSLLYIRTLERLIQAGQECVSSKQLADIIGLTDVQIRKDISNFGKAGRPRIGYRTQELKKILEEFVTQHAAHVALFGAGNLGSAILKYPGFQQKKIRIVAAFDADRRKIGSIVNGIKVYDIAEAKRVIAQKHAEIGIIAVPEDAAQPVADIMVAAGLKGIINFSPVSISVPRTVAVRNIDLAIEFQALFWEISRAR